MREGRERERQTETERKRQTDRDDPLQKKRNLITFMFQGHMKGPCSSS